MANGTQQGQRFTRASNYLAYLGRNQGPELFYTDNFGALAQSVIPKTLSMNRPLEALILKWSGRIDIAGANYTAAAAESPATILQRIRVTGTYKGSALTPIDLTGATAFAWPRLFGRSGSSLYINGVRQADPGDPYAQTLANFGNIGTYDVIIYYVIPTWPMVAVGQRSVNITPFCWQPRDWNDTLQVQLNYGDETSFGTPAGGTVVTFSAFGSAAGTPQVEIFTRYLILGPERAGFRSAAVVRNEQSVTQGVTGLANNLRLSVLQKQKTSNVLVKTGTVLAGTSAGVNVYSALDDAMIDVTQIMVDNRPVRNNQDDITSRESMMQQFGTILPEGYLPFSFIDSQTPRTAFRADLDTVVAPGAQFELVTNIISANAQNQANIVQEQIWADKDDPAWMGTR